MRMKPHGLHSFFIVSEYCRSKRGLGGVSPADDCQKRSLVTNFRLEALTWFLFIANILRSLRPAYFCCRILTGIIILYREKGENICSMKVMRNALLRRNHQARL